ncbi:ABC transporter [Streptomyces sp.]|uniref:ABC transporter n=1 Tax=Streptomyces sp. TaxID=1931 RepID=UPI002811E525|nr:ABC transporter [Streptomyces sp.]
MTALVRYHAGLLLRSQRWLAPLVLYAAVLGIGVHAGEPVLGALALTAAALLPVTAWAVRICLTQEPPAARAVVAAAGGRGRGHLAALLTGAGGAGLAGAVAVGTVVAVTDTRGVGPAAAVTAGLLGATACALVGGAVGALASRPFLKATGWSLAALVVGALLALVAAGSPARQAVTVLTTGSGPGVLTGLLPSAAGALVLASAVAALSRWATARLE